MIENIDKINSKIKRKININDCEATVANEVLEQTHAGGGEV